MKQTLFRIWFNGVGLTMWAWNLTEAIILVQAQRINSGLPYEVERADYKDNWGNWCEGEMPQSLTHARAEAREAAIDEAAWIAENHGDTEDDCDGGQHCWLAIAEDIRALKSKGETPCP